MMGFWKLLFLVLHCWSHSTEHITRKSTRSSAHFLVEPIRKFSGNVWVPGSKSISNRVLLLAAVCQGNSAIKNILDCDDTQCMLGALKCLGVSIHRDTIDKGTILVKGCDGQLKAPEQLTTLNLENAGTVMRPLTAMLAATGAGGGKYILDGSARMRERPIRDLVDGLQQLCVDISCGNTGCPPVRLTANGIAGGREISILGNTSSQYLSALLMALPLAQAETVVCIAGPLVSAPYVDMTLRVMEQFGVRVDVEKSGHDTDAAIASGGTTRTASRWTRRYRVKPAVYTSPGKVIVEGDASSASYFAAGGAITGGPVTLHGLQRDSIQGDMRFLSILEKMGATLVWHNNNTCVTVSRPPGTPLTGVDEDCGDIPDVAMTLAIVGVFATGKTVIRNVANWRHKETDRMTAMVTELRKFGVRVDETPDSLTVQSVLVDGRCKLPSNVAVETYEDHRMAMCFSLLACGGVPVCILNPGCVSKTFPDYFEKLSTLCESSTA